MAEISRNVSTITAAGSSNDQADTTSATGNSFGCSYFFEYETPKVVTGKNIPLGILRMVLHTICISFVVVYELYYARGYQEFAEVETSLTTKVKGFSM